jgi:hypothetical protein
MVIHYHLSFICTVLACLLYGSETSALAYAPRIPSMTRVRNAEPNKNRHTVSSRLSTFGLLSRLAINGISQASSSNSSRNWRLNESSSSDDKTTMETQGEQFTIQGEESWKNESKMAELIALLVWGVGINTFILINKFIGPWPDAMNSVPEKVFFTFHMLGGMLFGGGIILTTAIEWLVVQNKNSPVLQFWFDEVPLLDAAIVLPALTVLIISGTGLTIKSYGGLALAPTHITIVFYTLIAFAAWWASTDLMTQGKSLAAVNEWAITAATKTDDNKETSVPRVVDNRKISNAVSCLFVFALYIIMVMKPGTLHYF